MTPAASVVVPNWNGRAVLGECLHSLQRQTFTDVEVIVVDNGSTDGSLALLRSSYPWVRVVALERNEGFAGGVNHGIAVARGAYIALLNNDAAADPEWLARLVDAAVGAGADIVASKIVDYDDHGRLDGTGDFVSKWGLPYPRDRGFPDTGGYGEISDVFSASGGAALYRRDVFERVGLFDPMFFAYLEDVDLCFRARLVGMRVVLAEGAVVYHRQGVTSGRLPHFSRKQMLRNSWFLLIKDFPATVLLTVLPRFVFIQAVLLAAAVTNGAGGAALAAYGALVANLPALLAERRRIQRARVVTPAQVRGWLTDQWPIDAGHLNRIFIRRPGV